jgi:tol-pal system protein YbgF
MRRMSAAAAVVVVTVLVAPQPASAASKEQQLLMAELRIMQANQQQLAQSLLALAESLKSVTGRLDEQSATSRKALADQRLLIEGMTDTVRMLREKSDDTNVRLSSITQELESIRQTISSLPQPAAVAPATVDPGADPAAAAAPGGVVPPSPTSVTPPPNVSPQRTYDSAFSDYTAGQWDLAIEGFRTFLKYFPRHLNADDAQVNIGNALYSAGKFKEAITEYQRVISDYPKTDSVPAAYYKLGLTYNQLKQPDQARKAFDAVIQGYQGTPEATLANQAKQAMDRLGK